MLIAPIRSRRVLFSLRASAATVLLLLVSLAAADPIAGSDAAAAPNPAARAEAVFGAALDAYRGFKSYQEETIYRTDAQTEDDEGGFGDMPETTTTLAFAGPNRIAVVTQAYSVYCDGAKLWTVVPQINQFTEEASPSRIGFEQIVMEHQQGMFTAYPALRLLTTEGGTIRAIFPDIKTIESVTPEQRDGVAGQRITGTLEISMFVEEARVPFSMWFDDERHLLHEVRLDMADAYNGMRDAMIKAQKEMADEGEDPEDVPFPKYKKFDVTILVGKVVTDAKIPAERFTYVPDADMRKVDELDWTGGSEDGEEPEDTSSLIGQAAPEFTDTDVHGQPLTLTDLRGRVVLLDFWATWCGPCVKAIPHVQKLSEKYADKPVTIVGINQDQEGSDGRVKKFLDKKGITFRQVLGSGEELGEKYKVRGIPTMVVIDQQGVIQAVHVGFGPNGDAELAAEIDSLLAGKSLIDAEQLARERAEKAPALQADAGDNAPPAAEHRVEPRELTPHQFTELEKLTGEFQAGMGPHVRAVDVDGDGRDEVICPGWSGGINIISSDGGSVRKLRFKGIKRDYWLGTIDPVRIDGQVHWFVIATRYGSGPGDMRQRAQAGLFTDQGEQVWTFMPDLDDEAGCTMIGATGNLGGDERPEFVVGTAVMKMRKRGTTRYGEPERGYIAVLDASGALQAQRRVGKTIEQVAVIDGPSPEQLGTILCFTDGKLRRYKWDPTSAAPQLEDAANPAGAAPPSP